MDHCATLYQQRVVNQSLILNLCTTTQPAEAGFALLENEGKRFGEAYEKTWQCPKDLNRFKFKFSGTSCFPKLHRNHDRCE